VHMGRLLLKPFAPARGWDSLADGGVDICFVGGTHFTVIQGDNAAKLAGVLRRALNEASEN
jgi:thioesterase domain-containing protein